MRFLYALACLLLVAGCGKPPSLAARGPVHEITTYFRDGSWVYGNCFGIDPHTVATASHCVYEFHQDPNTNTLTLVDSDPMLIQIDSGEPLSIIFVDGGDNAPALLHFSGHTEFFATTTTATPGELCTLVSIFGGSCGRVYPSTDEFDDSPPTHDGWSGSPILNDHAEVVGVLKGQYANGSDAYYTIYHP